MQIRRSDRAARIASSDRAAARLARDTLQTDLPEDYLTFLGRNDGLDFNGFVIYGATEQKDPFPSAFVEANERLGGPEDGYVYYGDTGHQLYAQELMSQA